MQKATNTPTTHSCHFGEPDHGLIVTCSTDGDAQQRAQRRVPAEAVPEHKHRPNRSYKAERRCLSHCNKRLIFVKMPQLQMSPRYCNPEGLAKFLREAFPDVKSFMIREAGGNVDSAYTFYAPRPLNAVCTQDTATS